MVIDDKYREFVEADNQAVPVRKRLLKFLEDGGVVMPKDEFTDALKHAKRVYELNKQKLGRL